MRPYLLCTILALSIAFLAAPSAAFEAGAAKVDITPPLGVPMLGVPERVDLGATSVHAPLYARSLFLDDGATRVMLVTVDLYAIPPALREQVLDYTPAELPRENVILVATHTFSGPGGMEPDLPRRMTAGRFLPSLLDSTATGIAESMRLAFESRRRGAIGYALAKQTTLSEHRVIAQGPIDEQVAVVRVDDADGNPIAILANFSVRPSLVSELHPYAISSDFPGVFCDALEELTPTGCVGFFLNGAAADQTLANPENAAGWGQAESVAKLLAVFVKGAANQIAGTQGSVALHQTELALPAVLQPVGLPENAPLQHLEIGDLLITFLPATPGVRLTLDLRDRALKRGYAAQFVVGPASAHLGDILPRADYARPADPPFDTPFGPGAQDWIVASVETLMTRGEPLTESPVIPLSETIAIPGGTHLRLAGSPYAMGVRWGRAFQGLIHDAYVRDVAEPVSRAALLAESSLYQWCPPFIDTSFITLPLLAASVRPSLAGIPPSGQAFVEGLAEGAEQPFDAVWLAWNARQVGQRANGGEAPCTAVSFGVLGDMAGADQLLIGHTLAGVLRAPLLAASFVPDQGQPLLQLAEAGDAGFLAGVNAAGVALCIDRFPGDDLANGLQPFLAVKLRALLFESTDFDDALSKLRGFNSVRGYRFLLAGPSTEGFAAAFLDFGGETRVTPGKPGLVIDATESGGMSSRSAPLEARVAGRLGGERIAGIQELSEILTGNSGDERRRESLWSQDTQYALIIEPKQARMHLSLRGDTGTPTEYAVLTLAETMASGGGVSDE